jgi:tryptophan synthase beta chain
MGEIDVAKQHPNVIRMQLLGAKVVTVTSGGRCLKDAVDSAFQAFLQDPKHIFFGIGSVVGPHPFPMMVRDFQSVVGREAKAQILEKEGRLPDYLVACVGGGSNAISLFHEFLDEAKVKMIGVEPSGKSFKPGEHAATLTLGTPGNIHGMFTYLLQDEAGQPLAVHSIASGLDYPGVGPVHADLKDKGRVEYVTASDTEALEAFLTLSRVEGIIPALESAHALAYVAKLAPKLGKDQVIIVNLSGRGDKDVDYVAERVEL